MDLITTMQQLLLLLMMVMMIVKITSGFEVAPVRLQGTTKGAMCVICNIVRKL